MAPRLGFEPRTHSLEGWGIKYDKGLFMPIFMPFLGVYLLRGIKGYNYIKRGLKKKARGCSGHTGNFEYEV